MRSGFPPLPNSEVNYLSLKDRVSGAWMNYLHLPQDERVARMPASETPRRTLPDFHIAALFRLRPRGARIAPAMKVDAKKNKAPRATRSLMVEWEAGRMALGSEGGHPSGKLLPEIAVIIPKNPKKQYYSLKGTTRSLPWERKRENIKNR